MFFGKYKYSIDAKGRISIPAKMRKSVNPSANDTFVMTIGTEKCIAIYPMDEWDKYTKKTLEILDDSTQKDAWVLRKMFSESTTDQFDTQFRLSLPKDLIEYAELEKEAKIIGVMNKIEIWNPEKYEEYINDERSYADEVESTMGKKVGKEKT